MATRPSPRAKRARDASPPSPASSPSTHAGVAHLVAADPVLAGIVARVGPYTLVPRRHRDHFGSLARAIVFQQLSGKAADTIHKRFLGLFPEAPTPTHVVSATDAALRGAGLSRAKVAALRDLASAALDGRLPLPLSHRLADEEIVERLVSVRGIGPWTAQMFLMFHLGREDVLPTGDLGLRTAAKRAYRLRGDTSPERLERLAAPWRPYRSIATWYLWRSLETPGSNPAAAVK
jgi:3-methyladenine DNA glycosylase/8-oxoguanine DNA glycosylase